MPASSAEDKKSTAPIIVIINAGSGSVDSRDLADQIGARFAALGARAEVHLCTGGDQIPELAERAIRQGCTTLVAGGGDGTVSTVASVIAGSDVCLGVLPLGTLNHFAKDLGIPLELNGAIATIIGGNWVQIDIGEVNGHTFINNSSLGLYPRILLHREAQQRLGSSKWWAFFKALLTALGRYSFLRVRLKSDAGEIARRTPFVFIGNNAYEIHGLNIGTRSRIDSGQLSVYLTHGAGRLRLFGLALRGLCGYLRDAEDFETITTAEVTIDAPRRKLRVALDGEMTLMSPPLHYRCRRHQLRVIVGKT